MNRLEMNPNNEKYYSQEFIQGYKCGTKNQFDADVKVLEQIRADIEDYGNKLKLSNVGASIEYVLQIIDKYR